MEVAEVGAGFAVGVDGFAELNRVVVAIAKEDVSLVTDDIIERKPMQS